jgi:hypothetical protein
VSKQITELAQRCFGPEALTYQFADKLEDFAKGVAEMERERIGQAYDRLAMLHSETMNELIETRRQLKKMTDAVAVLKGFADDAEPVERDQSTLWRGIKRKVKRVLG